MSYRLSGTLSSLAGHWPPAAVTAALPALTAYCLLPTPFLPCYNPAVWQRWLNSFPELQLLDLDIGRGRPELRSLAVLPPLAVALMLHDERALRSIISHLIAGDFVNAAELAQRESDGGSLLPDVHLLAGACRLAEGRLADAAESLRKCYQSDPPPGAAARRLCPTLRLLLRLSPCLLLPLYPNSYGAGMLYAVALWRSCQLGEALEVAREMTSQWGLNDELKLLAGQMQIERGELEQAIQTLSASEETQHDSVELARCFYLAYAHYLREEYRSAARALIGAIRTVQEVNPHLHARARLLLAELYERNGLPLPALRESGHVLPEEVPGDVAHTVLEREERWVTQLGLLSDSEIEHMAHADDYQMYIPDIATPRAAYSPLDTTRDPMKNLAPRERSWLKRQAEERRIADYRAAAARGETIRPRDVTALSGAALDFRSRVTAAQRWWPSRRQALEEAQPRERLARQEASQVAQLTFDFCGLKEEIQFMLAGEKRAAMLGVMVTAIVFIGLGLWILRSCVYF